MEREQSTKTSRASLIFERETYEVWIQQVTPDDARKFLKNNYHKNRKIREHQVNLIAGLIRQKHYDLNGKPLIFDDKANLIDGQHRLLAIIRANIPVTCFCVSGIRTDAYIGLDQYDLRKSLADLVQGDGGKYPEAVASAISRLLAFKMDKLGVSYHDPSVSDRRTLLGLLKHHPRLEQAAAEVESLYNKSVSRPFGSSVGTFLFYVTCSIDARLAEEFMRTLYGLANLEDGENNPAFQIHRRVLRAKNSKRRGERLNARVIEGSVIKAWNLYVQSLQCTSSRHILMQFGEEFPGFKNKDGNQIRYTDIVWT